MASRTKAKVMNARLSPLPCTQDMREKMIAIASSRGISIAELQREALAIFLSRYDTQSIETDSNVSNTPSGLKATQ